ISELTIIPALVIAEILGVPREHQEDIRRWAHTFAHLSYGREDEELLAALHRVADEVATFLQEEIERHRRVESDDMINALIHIPEMTDGERCSAAVLMITAAYDTTAKLMANSLLAFESSADERYLVAEDPSLIPLAIEEVLRWIGVVHLLPRRVSRDTTLAG